MDLGLSNGSESEFFITLAAIAATLLGLSYLALNFFISSVFDRYKNFKMPVYSDEDRYQRRRRGKWSILYRNAWHLLRQKGTDKAQKTASEIKQNPDPQFELLDYPNKKRAKPDEIERQRSPYDVTDYQLFDGNPLIVFMAFAIAVSWNFYLVPLVISLTLISPNLAKLWVIALELAGFWGILTFSILVRHSQYKRLSTYRTREERLWALGEVGFLILLPGILLFTLDTIITQLCGLRHSGLCLIALDPMQAKQQLLLLLKVLCLISFLLGLYATNKDFFVFFKAKVSNEIRERWLEGFVIRRSFLEQKIEKLKETDPGKANKVSAIWNNGYPSPRYIRPGFSPYLNLKKKDRKYLQGVTKQPIESEPIGEKFEPDKRWKQLLKSEPTVGAWMFDVPGIAAWEHDVINRLIELEILPRDFDSSRIPSDSPQNEQQELSSGPQSPSIAKQPTSLAVPSISFILAGFTIGGILLAFLSKWRGKNIR